MELGDRVVLRASDGSEMPYRVLATKIENDVLVICRDIKRDEPSRPDSQRPEELKSNATPR